MNTSSGEKLVFFALQGIDLVVQSRCGKTERGARFADCPQTGQPMQRILALL